jgi:hypothetical protein
MGNHRKSLILIYHFIATFAHVESLLGLHLLKHVFANPNCTYFQTSPKCTYLGYSSAYSSMMNATLSCTGFLFVNLFYISEDSIKRKTIAKLMLQIHIIIGKEVVVDLI